MPLSSERFTVRMPLVYYAEEAGWVYLQPEEALRLRRGDTNPLLWEVFLRQVQRLNPGSVDALQAGEIGKRLASRASQHRGQSPGLGIPARAEGHLRPV